MFKVWHRWLGPNGRAERPLIRLVGKFDFILDAAIAAEAISPDPAIAWIEVP